MAETSQQHGKDKTVIRSKQDPHAYSSQYSSLVSTSEPSTAPRSSSDDSHHESSSLQSSPDASPSKVPANLYSPAPTYIASKGISPNKIPHRMRLVPKRKERDKTPAPLPYMTKWNAKNPYNPVWD